MMTLGQFKSQTDYDSASNFAAIARGATKRNRGANLKVIDVALGTYEEAKRGADPNATASALEHVIVACQWWLKIKAAKVQGASQTSNVAQREQTIRQLKTEALQALGTLSQARASFAGRKADAVEQGTIVMSNRKDALSKKEDSAAAVRLAGDYKLERQSYEKSGKQFAIAASDVFDSLQHPPSVSYKEYERTYKTLCKSAQNASDHWVAYLPKADRLKYLLVCNAGIFSYADGAPAGGVFGAAQAEPYAIDQYGNFYSVAVGTKTVKGKLFNHSCFTAGTPVMSAGMCYFDQGGHLLHIDNNSGHYKPDAQALRRGVRSVVASGVDATQLRVGVMGGGQLAYYKGSTFLSGGQPDWTAQDDQRRGLVGI